MEIRNAKYNQFGGIDCEIEHPVFGWIPFTANQYDSEELGAIVYNSVHDVADEYTAPVIDPAEALSAERAAMVASPAQVRLTLHQMGLLDTVQAMADADPQASIVWEYATQITRTSPFIEALKGDFTGEQIDEIFRYAMAAMV